jgi:D-glycero-D-manno-heptose 1,7-bisphosphate phosphatase
MVTRAAAELDLDVGRSWFIGDILDDVEAGNRAGCRTILVDLGTEEEPIERLRRPDYVARDTREALRIVRSLERLGPRVDLTFRPPRWHVAATASVSGSRACGVMIGNG